MGLGEADLSFASVAVFVGPVWTSNSQKNTGKDKDFEQGDTCAKYTQRFKASEALNPGAMGSCT